MSHVEFAGGSIGDRYELDGYLGRGAEAWVYAGREITPIGEEQRAHLGKPKDAWLAFALKPKISSKDVTEFIASQLDGKTASTAVFRRCAALVYGQSTDKGIIPLHW